MKKRILSILLTAVLLLTLLPTTAFATEYTTISSIALTDFIYPAPGASGSTDPTCTVESGYTLSTANWYNAEGNNQFTGVFVGETVYTVKFSLLAKDGYVFDTDLNTSNVTVDGTNATSVSVSNHARACDYATVTIQFTPASLLRAKVSDADIGTVAEGGSRAANPVLKNTGNVEIFLSAAYLKPVLHSGTHFTCAVAAGGGSLVSGATTSKLYVSAKEDLTPGTYTDTLDVYYDQDADGSEYSEVLLDTCTVSVTIVKDAGSSFYFDLADFALDTAKTEGENSSALISALSLSETADCDTKFSIDGGNSNLGFIDQNGVVNGISDGTGAVDLSKKYILSVTLHVAADYQFSEDVINDVANATAYVHGEKYDIVYASYNSFWNTLRLNIDVPWLFYDAEFVGANLSLGSELAFNYFVEINDTTTIDDPDKLAVQFTMGGNTTLVKEHTVSGDQYAFKFDGIAPDDVLEEIDATLVLLNDAGTDVERVLNILEGYSVATYIKSVYATTTDEDTNIRTMLSALVNYCSSAETYLSGTSNIWSALSGCASGVDITVDAAVNNFALDNSLDEGSRLTAAGVFFSHDNKIYVKIDAKEAVKLVVKKAGTEIDTVNYAAGTHKYYTDGIYATQFGTEYTFELYVGDAATATQTLTYSVYSYAYRMSGNASIGDLAKKLYYYGQCAKTYAGS